MPLASVLLFLALLVPTQAHAEETSAKPSPIPPIWRVLFLRVDFPDAPAKRPTSDFRSPARSGLIDRLVSYYDEVSRRRFQIQPIVSDRVYRLPRRKRFYVQKPSKLLADALGPCSRRRAPTSSWSSSRARAPSRT
jgi:hypothetical protein